MSMETFQNVADWIVSTDVSGVSSWEYEDPGFVPGLDDDTTAGGYLTSLCITDDFRCNDITDALNSPLQNPVPESWLNINDVLPCDNKASHDLFTEPVSDGDVLADGFGIQWGNVAADREQLPEVSISELESLLLMDSNSTIEGGCGLVSGCIAVDLESSYDNSTTQVGYICHVVEEEELVTKSHDVDEDSLSEEDDIRDATWSYHTHTTASRRRCQRRRPKQGRRLSTATNSKTDEQKKQQNKSAATRYREKKRCEEMKNEMLCAELEKRNKELHMRVQDMTQEVATLRQLVIDIFRNTK